MYVPVCGYIHMNPGTQGGQKLDPLALESQIDLPAMSTGN